MNEQVSLFFDCCGYGLKCCNCPFCSDGSEGCKCHSSTVKSKVKYLKEHPDFLIFCINNHRDIWEEIKHLFGARMS